VIGKRGIVAFRQVLLSVGQREDLAVQLDGAGTLLSGRLLRLVRDVQDFASQEGSLLIDLQKFEAFASLGDDVHASIVVGFGDGQDLGRAADIGQRALLRADHAEKRFLIQALSNHFLVARLENVQRQRYARKQNDIEREEREQGTQETSEGIRRALLKIVQPQLDFSRESGLKATTWKLPAKWRL